MPTAAKLMMSDEPPALMNGSVIPVIGTRVTTTPMLINAWAQPAGDPGSQQRPESVRRRERRARASVGQDEEQHDDRAGPGSRTPGR